MLTDAGRSKLEESAPTHVASVRDRMIDLLDEDDLVALARIFGRIRDGLDTRRGAKIAS